MAQKILPISSIFWELYKMYIYVWLGNDPTTYLRL